MTYELIKCDVEDNILTITLNRPDKMNAMTRELIDEFIQALRKANADDEVRAIIVTGAGRAFCAGHDMSSGASSFNMTGGAPPGPTSKNAGEPNRDSGGRLALELFDCLKPIIAAVNGPAVGIGATMLLPMDIRIASTNARFGFVFARRGLVPEAGSSWFLPRLVGISQALEWCYTGRVFGAAEALSAKLVSEVVDPDELMPRARAKAREIIDHCAPVAVTLIRQMLWRMLGADHPIEAHRIDSRGIFTLGASEDVKEGVNSFFEKRPPKFPMKVSTDMPEYFPWWTDRPFS